VYGEITVEPKFLTGGHSARSACGAPPPKTKIKQWYHLI